MSFADSTFVFICLNSLYLLHSHQRCIDWEFQFRFWSRLKIGSDSHQLKNRWTFFSNNLEKKVNGIRQWPHLEHSTDHLNCGGPDHLSFTALWHFCSYTSLLHFRSEDVGNLLELGFTCLSVGLLLACCCIPLKHRWDSHIVLAWEWRDYV